MAFGLKYVKGVEEERVKELKKDKDLFVPENYDENAPSRPIGVQAEKKNIKTTNVNKNNTESSTNDNRDDNQNNKSNTKSRFRSRFRKSNTNNLTDNQNQTKQNSSFKSNTSFRPASFSNQPVEDSNSIGVVQGNREDQASLRARRLVQEVGEFKKWSLDEMVIAEKKAMANPDDTIKEFLPIYKNEIKPHRDRGCRSLEEAMSKHSSDVVFLLMKGGLQKLKVMSRDDAGYQSLLHGAIVESIPAKFTKFKAPSDMSHFDKKIQESNNTKPIKDEVENKAVSKMDKKPFRQ